jgi:hypothetical protein
LHNTLFKENNRDDPIQSNHLLFDDFIDSPNLGIRFAKMRADPAEMDSRFNNESSNHYGAKMELADLLVFGILFVVAYIIYKILDRKMHP